MTSEVKLLTVQMAEALGAMSPEARVRMLRERGLIAPEPVDPLLVEAREVCACMPGVNALQAGEYRSGRWDAGGMVDLALAALRRGMELRPPLTRERVGEAFAKAASLPFQRSEDYYGITIDRLHAALTDAKGGE